jgi:type IV pilus assembly protein PilQ
MRWVVMLSLIGCVEQVAPPTVRTASAPSPQTLESPDPEPLDAAPSVPAVDRFATRTLGTVETRPRYTGRRIDVDLKDADVANVCRLIADVGNVNIVLGDGVQGSVTLTMHRVPWDQALESVLRAKGLRAEREGNVILVFAK